MSGKNVIDFILHRKKKEDKPDIRQEVRELLEGELNEEKFMIESPAIYLWSNKYSTILSALLPLIFIVCLVFYSIISTFIVIFVKVDAGFYIFGMLMICTISFMLIQSISIHYKRKTSGRRRVIGL